MTTRRVSFCLAWPIFALGICLLSGLCPVMGFEHQSGNSSEIAKSILAAVAKHQERFDTFCIDFELTSRGQTNTEKRQGAILRSKGISCMEFTQQTFSHAQGLRVKNSLSRQCSSGLVVFEQILDSSDAPGLVASPGRLIDGQNVRWQGALDPGSDFPFGPSEPFYLGMAGRINDIIDSLRNQKGAISISEKDGNRVVDCVVLFDNVEFRLSFSGDNLELIGFSRKWSTSEVDSAARGYFEHTESIETKDDKSFCFQVFKQALSNRVEVLRETEIKYTVRDGAQCRADLEGKLSKIPQGLEVSFKGSPQLKGVWTGDDVRLSYSSAGLTAVQETNKKVLSREPDYGSYILFLAFSLMALLILVRARSHRNA